MTLAKHRPARTSSLLWSLALFASGLAQAAPASHNTELALYRSNDDNLFERQAGASSAGLALVHEVRPFTLKAGNQDLQLDDLPVGLSPESLNLHFLDTPVQLKAQTLRANTATPQTLVGQSVQVLNRQASLLAQGILLSAGDSLLLRQADGSQVWIRDYALLRSATPTARGAALEARVTASHAGSNRLALDYATSGLAWRAHYQARLQQAEGRCQLRWSSQASLANRSGRDWSGVQVRLIANTLQPVVPMPFMRLRLAKAAMPGPDLPTTSTVGDDRQYQLHAPQDLPADSVTLVPLYPERDYACQRVALLDDGQQPWYGNKPQIAEGATSPSPADDYEPVTRRLSLRSKEDLPSGTVRILLAGRNGSDSLLGSSSIADTPASRTVNITLGRIFDLSAQRQRTGFTLNHAQHRLDERFRIQLENTGNHPQIVTVREHPSRWRQWRLLESNTAPAVRANDHLDFSLRAPGHGRVVLDYAVRYQWQAADE